MLLASLLPSRRTENGGEKRRGKSDAFWVFPPPLSPLLQAAAATLDRQEEEKQFTRGFKAGGRREEFTQLMIAEVHNMKYTRNLWFSETRLPLSVSFSLAIPVPRSREKDEEGEKGRGRIAR